jgi:hypothetical protein
MSLGGETAGEEDRGRKTILKTVIVLTVWSELKWLRMASGVKIKFKVLPRKSHEGPEGE